MYAEMNEDEAALFRDQMDEALRSGTGTLARRWFGRDFRRRGSGYLLRPLTHFLGGVPEVATVVTSREAGYRHVAGVLSSAGEQVSLAPFDEADVTRLCESWHVEVVADNDKVRAEAKAFGARDLGQRTYPCARRKPSDADDAIRGPTQCYGGELPTRRVKLYQCRRRCVNSHLECRRLQTD